MTATETRGAPPRTADVLVGMLRYLETWAPRHPELIPAVTALQQGARHWRAGDAAGAHAAAVTSFRLVQQARVLTPDLPVP